jgi:hypothetical protein
MYPAPSGLQEVDGLNHLLENLHPDRGSDRRCTLQSPRPSHCRNCSRSTHAPTDGGPTCGGIDTIKCTWSFATCPFLIWTSCCAQMSRIGSRTRVATSPTIAGRRYFVIQTKCRWISKTVCAPRRYSGILQAYPSARVLKPSPKGEGFNPSRLGQ